MPILRSQNPWLIASGAADGLGSTYANAIVQMAQLKAAQAQRQQELAMQQRHYDMSRQQMAQEQDYRNRALSETERFHTGELANRDEANRIREQLGMMASQLRDTQEQLKKSQFTQGVRGQFLRIPSDAVKSAQDEAGLRPDFTKWPVTSIAPQVQNAAVLGNALLQAGGDPSTIADNLRGLINPQSRFDVTPAQTNMVPSRFFGQHAVISPAVTNGIQVLPGQPDPAAMFNVTNNAPQLGDIIKQFLGQAPQMPQTNAPVVGKYKILSVQ